MIKVFLPKNNMHNLCSLFVIFLFQVLQDIM